MNNHPTRIFRSDRPTDQGSSSTTRRQRYNSIAEKYDWKPSPDRVAEHFAAEIAATPDDHPFRADWLRCLARMCAAISYVPDIPGVFDGDEEDHRFRSSSPAPTIPQHSSYKLAGAALRALKGYQTIEEFYKENHLPMDDQGRPLFRGRDGVLRPHGQAAAAPQNKSIQQKRAERYSQRAQRRKATLFT